MGSKGDNRELDGVGKSRVMLKKVQAISSRLIKETRKKV